MHTCSFKFSLYSTRLRDTDFDLVYRNYSKMKKHTSDRSNKGSEVFYVVNYIRSNYS